MQEYTTTYASPLGTITITGSSRAISVISFKRTRTTNKPLPANLKQAVGQLQEYFAGKRRRFSLKLELAGTPFQKKIWNKLLKIHYGKTLAYSSLGQANRAIGTACGQNKIAIVIPCHRVINKNGGLGGYDGGLWRKKWLLEHEKH
jgi:methylated-DNA-[protein]-cysteine S-methyltransferase